MQAQQSVAVNRRSPVAAPAPAIVNDIGLLNAEQIPAFRVYLEESGLLVRDSAGSGQFFHVRLPELPRWLAIERGCGGAPVTPDVLRPFVASFLKKPLDSALGDVRAVRYAAERAVARAALALPRECDPVASVDSAPGEEVLSTNALDYRPTAPEFQSLGEQRAARRQALQAPAPAAQVVSDQGVTLKSTVDAQYLSDLRDDFALHAPIPLGEHATAEDMRNNAIRRWAYADVMLAIRTTKAGD